MTVQPLDITTRPNPRPTLSQCYAAGGRVLTDPTLTTLPPLPSDARGRHTSWVILASTPGMYYWPPESDDHETGQFFQAVDDAWLSAQLEAFAALTADGYTLPVRDRHQPSAIRYGDVLSIATWEDPADGETKLIGALAWAIDGARDMIQSGQLAYTSPGFHTFADDSGRLYEGVLSEVSICDAPYQKHIDGGRNRHILNTETTTETRPMADDTSTALAEGAPDESSNEPTMADLMARIDAMDARIVAMEGETPDDKDEVKEDPEEEEGAPEMTELAELRAQVNALTEEKNRAVFAQDYPEGHTITLTADLRDTLYQLHRNSPEEFATLAEHAKAPPAEAPGRVQLSETPRPPATPRPLLDWGKRHGTSTGAPTGDAAPPMSLEERKRSIMAECKREAGGDASRMMALYTERVATLS